MRAREADRPERADHLVSGQSDQRRRQHDRIGRNQSRSGAHDDRVLRLRHHTVEQEEAGIRPRAGREVDRAVGCVRGVAGEKEAAAVHVLGLDCQRAELALDRVEGCNGEVFVVIALAAGEQAGERVAMGEIGCEDGTVLAEGEQIRSAALREIEESRIVGLLGDRGEVPRRHELALGIEGLDEQGFPVEVRVRPRRSLRVGSAPAHADASALGIVVVRDEGEQREHVRAQAQEEIRVRRQLEVVAIGLGELDPVGLEDEARRAVRKADGQRRRVEIVDPDQTGVVSDREHAGEARCTPHELLDSRQVGDAENAVHLVGEGSIGSDRSR